MVEQPFGVQTICTHCTAFYICMREKKEERKEDKKKRTKSKFSCLIFSNVRMTHGTLAFYFYIRMARAFVCIRILHHCAVVTYGAAPLPFV